MKRSEWHERIRKDKRKMNMQADKIDVLNRDKFIGQLEKIVQTLSEKKRGCCFGIDGAWGSGKTFVLEEFEHRISERQSEETKDDQFYVFHYNCWKYDYYEEPLQAIVIAMLDEVQDKISTVAKKAAEKLRANVEEKLRKIVGEICKNKIGINLVEIVDFVDDAKKNVETEKESVDQLAGFRKALATTREEIKNIVETKTMVIVVDELDRCLPEYSIKVLERLHHIFDGLDNVIVIIAMDKSQLEKSIAEIFGEIDVDIYLRKFMAFKVDLDNGHASMYAKKYESYFSMFTMTTEEKEEIEELFADILQGLDMRTQERIFRKAQIIHEMIEDGQKEDCSIMAFEILYLTISLKMKRKDNKWLCDILDSPNFNDLLKNEMGMEKIDGEYFDMLHGYAYAGINSEQKYRKYYHIVLNTVIGKMFFWMANVFNTYNGGICGAYYCEWQGAEDELERNRKMVKLFAELIDIISCD